MTTHVDSTSDARTANNAVRHTYRILSDAEKAQMQDLKDKGLAFIEACNGIGKSRELSLAITNAEQAVMWAVKHVTAWMPPKIEKGFDPIQAKHREDMQAVFGAICEAMPGVGLCLFLFDEQASQPRANYISNTDRKQTLAAIKEWVARQEANGI